MSWQAEMARSTPSIDHATSILLKGIAAVDRSPVPPALMLYCGRHIVSLPDFFFTKRIGCSTPKRPQSPHPPSPSPHWPCCATTQPNTVERLRIGTQRLGYAGADLPLRGRNGIHVPSSRRVASSEDAVSVLPISLPAFLPVCRLDCDSPLTTTAYQPRNQSPIEHFQQASRCISLSLSSRSLASRLRRAALPTMPLAPHPL